MRSKHCTGIDAGRVVRSRPAVFRTGGLMAESSLSRCHGLTASPVTACRGGGFPEYGRLG
ncbi:hypothetical protein XCR_3363 [Xanthomonas campestris pv. raphani 756C]|nr:hypothetical protein XCR_3363 [Xanthomonas campestris pv. raphani 756C]